MNTYCWVPRAHSQPALMVPAFCPHPSHMAPALTTAMASCWGPCRPHALLSPTPCTGATAV